MTLPPKQVTGNHPLVTVINTMIRMIAERTPIETEQIKYDLKPNGYRAVVRTTPRTNATSGAGEMRRVVIASRFDDHLGCNPIDEFNNIDSSTAILVAKPSLLRKSKLDGLGRDDAVVYNYISAQERTITYPFGGFLTGTQFLRPSYDIGDELIVAKPTGGTGLTVGEERIVWIDLNVDGRNWILGAAPVKVCLPNNTLGDRVFLTGSEPASP